MAARIQRRRTPGWRMRPNTIYVGRPTVFGNPWKVVIDKRRDIAIDGPGIHFLSTDDLDTAHDYAVAAYRDWLINGNQSRVLSARRISETSDERDRLEARRRRILGQLKTLAGRDLACWCPRHYACHVDVLLALANGDGMAA